MGTAHNVPSVKQPPLGDDFTEDELIRRLTAAMREADATFERVGGSTRHHVRDCLLPILGKHRLALTLTKATP
jgi:hypothetical protein